MDSFFCLMTLGLSVFVAVEFVAKKGELWRRVSPSHIMAVQACVSLGGCLRRFGFLERLVPSRQRISLAGLDDIFDPHGLLVFQMMWVLAVVSSIVMVSPQNFGAAQVLSGCAVGFASFELWLRRRCRKRRIAIERKLPYAFDVMAISVEAGADFVQALSKIEKGLEAGPLKFELGRFATSMRLGLSRREALRELAARSGVPSMLSFASLLIQADQFGTSMGPALAASAESLRRMRFEKAERSGIKAAQKLLVPLIFCVMPSTLIVVFGPLAVRLVTGGFDRVFY